MAFTYKPLFKLLIDRDMKKTDLRGAVGIGPSTLAKFEKGEYVSLEVLDRLCNYFGVQPNDLLEHIPDAQNTTEA
ncbi:MULTISPECIES: helix-turn-helix domain-containing protein [unclassified Paenibacillus]|uniref:helix-turn-helix domain-containing protein n=1 Tax=unclassified Paenibacillus TaxID=185978 RepID=UPI00135ADB9F|nr:helix-turn-helix transcriptional regulator [Paenibacillus sp. USDA918EY]